MKPPLLTAFFIILFLTSSAQNGWKVCNTPGSTGRIDDIFMVNTQIGYAVNGSGVIMKSVDGGENWFSLRQISGLYCRSVEFINAQKGFVGGFPNGGTTNILQMTIDGGTNWTDLTASLHPKARKGICGLAVADNNTIYGGGNWYEDSSYIIKSTDGGTSWSFIDMSLYATSIIDLNFSSKDTGFATGKSKLPDETAIILHTTDGGVSWSIKHQGTTNNSYCWKIQRLTPLIYFGAIEDLSNIVASKIVRSDNGGMTWVERPIGPFGYNIEGIGFIDPMHGWVGGGNLKSFETKDGGLTWDSIPVCPFMNRVFKVNDTVIFASGRQIWKYKGIGTNLGIPANHLAAMKSFPNPVKTLLTIDVAIATPTQVSVLLLDEMGRRVKIVDNANKPRGSYRYRVDVNNLRSGVYYLLLKTHEEKLVKKIWVMR